MSGIALAQLGEIADLQAGVSFPVDLQGRSSGDYPVAKVGDISRVGRSGEAVISAADHYIDEGDLARLRARPIPPGSVLFAKIGEAIRQNHRVIAGCALLVDNNAMAAIPTRRVDSRYLYHFLRTVDFYGLASATTVPALRKSELEHLPVPLPPLPEQWRIAEILDKAAGLRAKRRAALAQLDTLTQSIFLDMFGDPATNPKGWPTSALADLFEISRGGSPRPIDDYITESPDGVSWIMIGDAPEGSKYITATKKKIKPEGVKRSRSVKPGDFLLTNSMSFGRPYIMRTSGCIHDGWLVLSPRKSNVVPDYFYSLLGSRALYTEFSRRAPGATVKNLNIGLVRSVVVPVPPEAKQREYADRVSAIEGLTVPFQRSLDGVEGLFASLQQRAFRGEL